MSEECEYQWNSLFGHGEPSSNLSVAMVDSWGKPPSGILQQAPNVYMIGQFSECKVHSPL